MKLFLEPELMLRQPRRWAALLPPDPGVSHGAGRSFDIPLLLHYLAREFVTAKSLVVQRRAGPTAAGPERFLLRPIASSRQTAAPSAWLGLVCEYDASRRALRIVDRAALQSTPVTQAERVFTGEIATETRPLAPAYCDSEAVAFLRRLPAPPDPQGTPTEHWKEYIEWRRRIAETQAAESHAYAGLEVRPRRTLRFFLRDPAPAERLRQLFQDEELRAGADAAGPSDPQGTFRRLGHAGHKGRRGSPAVDVEYDENAWNAARRLPQSGNLRLSMEGELASLSVLLDGLRRLAEGQALNPGLASWLFDTRRPPALARERSVAWQPLQPLNQEQRAAVGLALGMEDLSLLWGPPGTGKTTVIAEICAQYALRGQRVLVASQANLAVSQALARLPRDARLRPVWISTARKRTAGVGDVRGHLLRWMAAAADSSNRAAEGEPPGSLWTDFLRQWAGRIADTSAATIVADDEERYLRQANIVGATCGEAGKPDFIASHRFSAHFDLVIVDEVSKASPPELLLAMLLGRRVLLAGDHRQLPPVFRDETFEEAVESGEIERRQVERFRDLVSTSWFEEAYRRAPPSAKIGLSRQYRMHPGIMDAVNAFYADQPLQAGDCARALAESRGHPFTLRAPDGNVWLQPGIPLCWIDTGVAPRDSGAREEYAGTSRRNPLEAKLGAHLVAQLEDSCRASGLSLGVISFYRAQADLLRERIQDATRQDGWLHPWRDINTVDQFQGSERDVVIVSLVRTGGRLTGEFARDFRRINVAFSRARRLLIILGCRRTFGDTLVAVPTHDGGMAPQPAYRTIQELASKHGALLSAERLLAPPHRKA